MTNAEKYLKVSVNEFFSAIIRSQIDIGGLYSLEKWLFDEAKPTLTEDERVILRNINANYIDTISRNSFGELILHYAGTDNEVELHYLKEGLFQFIKEGEEYPINELLGDD